MGLSVENPADPNCGTSGRVNILLDAIVYSDIVLAGLEKFLILR